MATMGGATLQRFATPFPFSRPLRFESSGSDSPTAILQDSMKHDGHSGYQQGLVRVINQQSATWGIYGIVVDSFVERLLEFVTWRHVIHIIQGRR
jgi:hypothetical protein